MSGGKPLGLIFDSDCLCDKKTVDESQLHEAAYLILQGRSPPRHSLIDALSSTVRSSTSRVLSTTHVISRFHDERLLRF